MSQIIPIQQSAPPRQRRYKTSLACTTCRRRKLKCDGRRPACSRCQDHDHRESCTYIHNSDSRSSASSHLPEVSYVAPSPLHSSVPAISTPTTTDPVALVDPHSVYDDGESTEFASRVRAAIENNLGLPAAKKRCPIPLTDAPLFGEGPLRNQPTASGIVSGADIVLPTRKHADHLMSLYWQHLEPFEPLFNKSRFSRSYQTLFAGGELDCDEQVFSSTLNAIFALSTQLQEWLLHEQRDEASKVYFQRAWSLLRPEVIVWEPGSVEVIQCLLLMARYLQCTRNLHHTWMVVGSAVHIARSLGLHSPAAQSSSGPGDRDGWLGRQVWQCCASMERALSWTLGQTSMTSLTVSPLSMHFGQNHPGTAGPGPYPAKMAELNEITSYIMLSQSPTRNSVADSLGLPPLVRAATDVNAVTKIERRLNQFEESLSHFWDSDGARKDIDDSPRGKQHVLFGLRIAHARILLFRPMLATFCLPQDPLKPPVQDLDNRILQSCATLCVENVQRLIDEVISTTTTPTLSSGVLPWWHRIFYLNLASQHLIAAMLRPAVFRHMVVDHWHKAISTLCTHEHLSLSITRCIASLRGMWHKVVDLQDPAGVELAPETFQDVFQHLGFETDGQQLFNFGVGDGTTGAWTAGMADFDWNSNQFLDGGGSYTMTDLMCD